MNQGGGFDTDMKKKQTKSPIKLEAKAGRKNKRGTLAMARTSNPDSATSQFFINTVDNRSLDYPSNGGYAVFGKVVGGMDVVDAIAKVQTGMKNGMRDVPKDTVIIQSAVRAPCKVELTQ